MYPRTYRDPDHPSTTTGVSLFSNFLVIKEEAPGWDEFTPSVIKEELRAVEAIKEEAPGWDESTPSRVNEELVEFTYRP